MKIFEIIWRVIALILSSLVLIAVIPLAMYEPLRDQYLLICYGAAYLLSLSTALRLARRLCQNASGLGKFFTYLIFVILNAVMAPVTLVISVFGRIKRLHNFNDYTPEAIGDEEDEGANGKRLTKAERNKLRLEKEKMKLEEEKLKLERERTKAEISRAKAEAARAKSDASRAGKSESKGKRLKRERADAVNASIRSSVWRSSSRQAIAKILDDSYKGDIKMFDGSETKIFKQVALIKLSARQYALLSPKNEDSESYGSAVAYAIVPDAVTGERILKLVEDEGLYQKIYSVYESLLNERNLRLG